MHQAIQANPFLAMFGTLVLIVAIGGAAHIMLTFCDNSKAARLVDKGTWMGALGTLITMGLMVMGNIFEALTRFMKFIFG